MPITSIKFKYPSNDIMLICLRAKDQEPKRVLFPYLLYPFL